MPLFGRRKNPPNPACSSHGPCRALSTIAVPDLRHRLRLLIARSGPELGLDTMARPLDDELSIVLCVKGGADPAGVTDALIVPEHAVDQWGVARSELWDWALANLSAERLNRQSFPTAGGDTLHVVNGMDWPGAGQVLHVEHALGAGAELANGALVTVPTCNVVCAVPILTAGSLEVIPYLIELSQELAAGDAAALGSALYWYQGGQVESLNARLQDGRDARMRVSTRFKQMMDHLPAK